MRTHKYTRHAQLLERRNKLEAQLEDVNNQLKEYGGSCTSWTDNRAKVTGFTVNTLAELANAADMEHVNQYTNRICAPLKGWQKQMERGKTVIWLTYWLPQSK